MGLDMYLTKKTYISRYNDDIEITIKKNGVDMEIDTERIKGVVEEVGYWRKFNALHNWFVKNCQDGTDDCDEYIVEQDKIDELITLLKEIDSAYSKSEKKGIGKAQKLLPTQDGFFFGHTQYDEYYFDSIKNTLSLLEKLKSENNLLSEFYYRASW